MKLLFISVVFLVLGVVSSGRRGRNRNESNGQERRGGKGRREGGMLLKFPECKDFSNALKESKRELRTNREIGPSQCQGNFDECVKQDMEKVRCRVTEPPSNQCIEKVTQYMQGEFCEESEGNGGTGGSGGGNGGSGGGGNGGSGRGNGGSGGGGNGGSGRGNGGSGGGGNGGSGRGNGGSGRGGNSGSGRGNGGSGGGGNGGSGRENGGGGEGNWDSGGENDP